ncbi:uncharacterized protein LOC110975438 isoform X2 [Acanthaster planci]|nr:uncharacterized protein LOC110975438 isoform X2 [Acanthaster planci]XP_022083656.1 uncharacterized protein LOC110975438 isoform X2 [Acanthaster planci]
MDLYQAADDEMETDGSTDPDQTGLVQHDGNGSSLDQLKSEQARLLQHLHSSDSFTSLGGGTGHVANPEPNGAVGGGASPEEQQATSQAAALSETTVVSPTGLSMPGLQPFPPAKNQLPSSWSDCTLSPDVPFCLVMLNKQSWEFQSILAEFTAADLTVKKIERVENRDLWDKFQFERTRMLKNRAEVNEVYLFHGTTADKEQICHEGLDQRLSRIGYFGRGIYFSNDPRKCVSYTQGDKGSGQPLPQMTCTIYKCRALMGNMKVYPNGQHAKDLKREPEVENPEPGGPKYYDSVKGHVKEYDEFILYKSERVMPEYVISCFMPMTSSSQGSVTLPAVTPLTNHGGGANMVLYGGLDQEEVNAELAAGVLSTHSNKGLSKGTDDGEISAELAAGALGLPKGTVARQTEKKAEDDDVSLELRAEASERPRAEEVTEDSHPELEGEGRKADSHLELREDGDVYEQLHQREILDAIRARERREKEQLERFLEFERQKGPRDAGRKEWAREEPHSITINQLQDEEVSAELSVGGTDTTDAEREQKQPALQRPTQLLKSSEPIITVNPLEEEPRRYKKETIAPEFLPTVLEVRERVQKARLKEKEMEGKTKQTQGASTTSERKTPRWVHERDAPAWTPREYAEQQKLIGKVREKVRADRKAEEQERERQRRSGKEGRSQKTTDNSLSPQWKGQEDDGVGEVMDVLIVQFMEVTACDDITEAREFIQKANMDVNTAIISYLSG